MPSRDASLLLPPKNGPVGADEALKVSVVVPTYNRAVDLVRTLEALKATGSELQEVRVVARKHDFASIEAVERLSADWGVLRLATTGRPGQVEALNTGLAALDPCDVVLFVDDDACLLDDWLGRLQAHFRDAAVGGVGGRDRWMDALGQGSDFGAIGGDEVGRISWFGKTRGNHHLGVGEAREVDILKGVLMAFRYDAVKHARFDRRLRGSGAQVHNDMDWSLRLRRAGWKLIYDPGIVCDHYLAKRFDEDQRDAFSPEAVRNAVHNHAMVVLQHLNAVEKGAYLLWGLLVGTRGEYGLLQVFRHVPRDGTKALLRGLASFHGRILGFHTLCFNRERPSQPESPATLIDE